MASRRRMPRWTSDGPSSRPCALGRLLDRPPQGARALHHPRQLLRDRAGHLDRDHGSPEGPGRAGVLADRALVGSERQHARLRRPSPARSPGGGPPRPPAHIHHGDGPLHGRIARRWRGAVGRMAHRRPRRPGSRSRHPRPLDACPFVDELRGRPRAHPGRRLVWRGCGRWRERRLGGRRHPR